MIGEQIRQEIEQLAGRYPSRQSALLPALSLVQDHCGGCVEPADLAVIGDMLGVSVANVRGVQSFYSMFNLRAVGKYHLQVDTCVPGMLMGADEILAHLEKTLGIKVGQTTDDDMFTLSAVQDLGSCGTCPVMQVNDRYYEDLTVGKVDELIKSLRSGKMPEGASAGKFASKPGVLLKRRGTADRSLKGYTADGGYAALDKALAMPAEKVIEEVTESFLRGLGGAGFPTGAKWKFLPKNSDKPVYLICNADEGEPGTFKDRQIMESDPHLLLEGMTITAFAIGAKLGFVYIRGEFGWIADILEEAIEQAKAAGKLGTNIGGKGFDFDIVVHRGAGAYVCGEETALIESLEGKRGYPRLKPPFPAVAGLYGCPTIVNNVETLSSIPYIIGQGADAFKKFGSSNNYGFKIFGVSGHVNSPGTYEFALGTSLKDILAAAGGVQGNLKAVIVGGLSVPILTAAEAADVKMDFDGCLAKDTMLGSGGVIVINDSVSIPKLALRTAHFYEHESCGQCTPCRQGTRLAAALLKRLIAGAGTRADIQTIANMCKTVQGLSLCPMGDAWGMSVGTMLNKFGDEFEALVNWSGFRWCSQRRVDQKWHDC